MSNMTGADSITYCKLCNVNVTGFGQCPSCDPSKGFCGPGSIKASAIPDVRSLRILFFCFLFFF